MLGNEIRVEFKNWRHDKNAVIGGRKEKGGETLKYYQHTVYPSGLTEAVWSDYDIMDLSFTDISTHKIFWQMTNISTWRKWSATSVDNNMKYWDYKLREKEP